MSLLRRDISWDKEFQHATNHGSADPLAIIYNEGQWRLNKVSPMYDLRYTAVRLKQYAAKVRQDLVSAVQASSAKYTVTFEELPNLKYSEDDAPALMIIVSSTQESNNAKTKIAYSAVLLSWGVSEIIDRAVHLPYMLERGEQRVGTAVKSTVQKMFDCNITQYSFTQHQLLQFSFNFVECDTSRGTDQFTLLYRTPQVELKDKLSVTFDIRDIHIIWNGIKEVSTKHSETVSLAYQILQNQIFCMNMLDITAFELCEINLSKAEIKNNGVVKMKTPEIVNCVLTVLNEISSVHTVHSVLSENEFDAIMEE